MTDRRKQSDRQGDVRINAPKVKLVAEMPEDGEIREQLEERKQTDGYPGSCGL